MFLLLISYKSFLLELFSFFEASIFNSISSCLFASFGLFFLWKKKFPNKGNNFWGLYFIFLGAYSLPEEIGYQKAFSEWTWTYLWIFLTVLVYMFFRSILIMGGIKVLFEEYKVVFSWKKVWGIFFLMLGLRPLLQAINI